MNLARLWDDLRNNVLIANRDLRKRRPRSALFGVIAAAAESVGASAADVQDHTSSVTNGMIGTINRLLNAEPQPGTARFCSPRSGRVPRQLGADDEQGAAAADP